MIGIYKTYRDLGKLIKDLEKDSKSTNFARFPARFILVDDPIAWKKIIEYLKGFVDITLEISEYCEGEDAYPDLNKVLSKAFKFSKQGKKVLLLPISEILRVDETTKSKIAELLEFQIDPARNGRLYMPLYCVSNQFLELFKQHFDKIRVYPPLIIRSESHRKINLYILKDYEAFKDFALSNLNVIFGFKSLLKIWESANLSEKILVSSECMYEIASQIKSRGNVQMFCIKDYKDFIEKVIGINVPIDYRKEEEDFWRSLIKLFLKSNCKTFEELVKKELNVNTFSEEIFYRWKNLPSNLHRWLLFYWGKTKTENDATYLSYVIKYSDNFLDFEKNIWLSINKIEKIKIGHIKERVHLIRNLKIDMPEEFLIELKKLNDPIRKIKVLSGTCRCEQLEIIKCLGQLLKERTENEFFEIFEILNITFPEIKNYLSFLKVPNEKLEKYMKTYIRSKLINHPTEELYNLSKEVSKDNITLCFPNRNNILENYKDFYLVWIDGLGIEWIGLIYNFLRSIYEDYEVNFEIGRANLPTTSEFNTPPSNISVISQESCLDRIFHSNDYKYPDSLIEEIDCILKILKKIDTLLKNYKKIVITSDHGSTRFAGWCGKKIKKKGDKIERNGRYVILSKKPETYEIECYVESYDGKYYLISKSHKNFEGGRKVAGENHGGGTVEEVLVPIIVISPKIEKIKTIIKIEKDVLYVLKPILKVRIYPPIKEEAKVKLKIGREIIYGEQIDDEVWIFDLAPLKLEPGEYRIVIETPVESKDGKIRIEGGMAEENIL